MENQTALLHCLSATEESNNPILSYSSREEARDSQQSSPALSRTVRRLFSTPVASMSFLVMASAGTTVCFASTTIMSSVTTPRLSPLRSQQIYDSASLSPRIKLDHMHKMKMKTNNGSYLSTRPVKAIGVNGAGDHTGEPEKPKYKGTLMREKHLTEMIEKMVAEAKETCQGDASSDECKVAWDEVEEVSSAKADLRFKLEHKEDPLESFCNDNPETDECRIYED